MTVLTEAQFQELENCLISDRLQNVGLHYDLLDHFYCLTTLYMDQGKEFPEAMAQAKKELAPEGFSTIEEEVSIFLQFNFQIQMNRILYSGAFLATFGQTAYVLFRNLKWPAANAFLILGIMALFFMVLPVLSYRIYKRGKSMEYYVKFRMIIGMLAIALFGLGSAFKVFYLPGANIQILAGTALLALGFFPMYFWQLFTEANKKEAGNLSLSNP
jgi:hypothetical protein